MFFPMLSSLRTTNDIGNNYNLWIDRLIRLCLRFLFFGVWHLTESTVDNAIYAQYIANPREYQFHVGNLKDFSRICNWHWIYDSLVHHSFMASTHWPSTHCQPPPNNSKWFYDEYFAPWSMTMTSLLHLRVHNFRNEIIRNIDERSISEKHSDYQLREFPQHRYFFFGVYYCRMRRFHALFNFIFQQLFERNVPERIQSTLFEFFSLKSHLPQ